MLLHYLPNFSLLNVGTNVEYERWNSEVKWQKEKIKFLRKSHNYYRWKIAIAFDW